MGDENNLYGNSGQSENVSGNASSQDYGRQAGYNGAPDYNTASGYNGSPDYNTASGYNGSPDDNATSGYNSASDYNTASGYNTAPDYNPSSGYNPPPGGSSNGYYGQPPSQGFGIASMVCGILALVTCCIWCLSVPLGIVSIVLGILQIQKKTAKGMAIAGIVCSVIGILLTALISIYAGFIQRQYMDSPMYNEILQEIMDEMYDY